MTILEDPEANEVSALKAMVDVASLRVLEIGCGDGRLAWRYAASAAHVTAIDPFADSIERAKERFPETLTGRVEFRHVGFEGFGPADDRRRFDALQLGRAEIARRGVLPFHHAQPRRVEDNSAPAKCQAVL